MARPGLQARTRAIAAGAGLAVIAAALWLALLAELGIHAAVIALVVASLGWLLACWSCWDGGSVRWIVAGAVLLRGIALAAPEPRLSDDVYRYAWEGEVLREGLSPFRVAPEDPELAPLRARHGELYRHIDHRDVSAVYPPLQQACSFAAATLAAALGAAPEEAAVRLLRVGFALCDLLVLVPLIACLRAAGLPPSRACVWAWSPLAAVEFGASGHFDSLGILLFVAGLAALSAPRPRAAAAHGWLVAAALVKFLPAIAWPWAWRATPRERRVPALLAAGLAIALAAAPFVLLGGGRPVLDGLREYGSRWESASLVYRWVEAAFGALFGAEAQAPLPRRLARAAIGAAWLAIACRTWLSVADPVRGCSRLVGAFLLLSPTLHPWYLAWMLPFLALRSGAAWMVLVALMPLAYWPLARWHAERVWIEPGWLWPALALPFAAAAALELARRRARAAGGDSGRST